MTPLESVLAAWIAFHAELGVDIETFLNPPATEAQIVEVEEVIGYRLPEDLRELYKIANGQWYMFADEFSDLVGVDRDQRWAPLFGNYDFMPLQRALRQYEFYLDGYNSSNEFNTKYYQANPEKTFHPVVWEVRESDAVDPAGWNPNWFTFAGSDANSYSVDLLPPRGGTPGQVVLHGADEHILQVPGHSVTDLMEQAVTHLNADEEHRFQYGENDGLYMASVYFDMDWRGQLYIPQEQPEQVEMPAAYVAWMEEQEQAQEIAHQQLDVWLQGRDMPAEQRSSLIQWYDFRLSANRMGTPPASVMREIQMQSLSQGNMSEAPANLSVITSSGGSNRVLQSYASNLASAIFTGDSMASGFGLAQTVDEAIDLFHQFKLESGEWSRN